jgi:2-polyprenyl-3-methyl-5-hydroxy-6-metoxy-1,4-benzoquinol methylase
MKRIIENITPPFIFKLYYVIKRNVRRSYLKSITIKEKNESFYDLTFRKNDHWKNHYSLSHYFPLWSILVDRLKKNGFKELRILDIGCGPGQVAEMLYENGFKGYTGIDFSSARINFAKSKNLPYNFIKENVFKTNIWNESAFDIVLCLEFLEHINDDLELLNKLPKGMLFFGTVPNFPSDAHVRHFENCDSVLERYRNYFKKLSVTDFNTGRGKKRYFIMEGVK